MHTLCEIFVGVCPFLVVKKIVCFCVSKKDSRWLSLSGIFVGVSILKGQELHLFLFQ